MFPGHKEPEDILDAKRYITNQAMPRPSCVHVNLQPNRNKCNIFESFFHEVEVIFDVAMFTETWFESTSDVFNIPLYKPYCMNQICKRGGGMCMMISKKIHRESLPDCPSVTPDYRIDTVKSGLHIISARYLPLGYDGSKFVCFLDSFF